ncbi:hypothetical protein COV49_03110 [Candidatus Falkowbacteria bacterium CG11_big_fil_rev_8_21_14_0_20_39_10]|uniref:Type 4 fimbrial biogenesis protein PilX N-terminal domain-containing protein n=1 Tax=Candidatus Falkowbacteria bacterium CG11_big_fil_rev_8_21_14_0_20_39_10 TaxID=1974570 RepID=A0A2M6K8J9_9BACT|nr:MAG: hypothetical protein COV49_03110 [Candidatus Falkowbacteria bacterium CG11_big_fil_rev_8_21_14_0_20_39_10]
MLILPKLKSQEKGVAILVIILLMTLLLFMAMYFLSFTLTEKNISHSQAWGAKTYYLAEAGVAEMVWQLKNNPSYETSFETNPAWTVEFTRNNPFGADSGSYTVSITNSALAHGEIISTGAIDVGEGKTSQRIIKTSVYRAMGEGGAELGDNCGYADGNIDISASIVNFYNGSAYSDNNFNANLWSTVGIDTDLNVVNNFNEVMSTVLVGGDIYAANYPNGPAAEVDMPAVDFDSGDPDSYKNIADVVYTSAQFDNMIANNSTITLNDPITYVEGDIDFYGNKNLVVNGLLVVERDFEIGRKLCRGFSCGLADATVNHTEGEPSGILAKRKIYFKTFTGNIDINGVVYASDQLTVTGIPLGMDFNAAGGLISRKLTITSVWSPIDITRNEEIINSTLGVAEFSPVITVEHWEEEY